MQCLHFNGGKLRKSQPFVVVLRTRLQRDVYEFIFRQCLLREKKEGGKKEEEEEAADTG